MTVPDLTVPDYAETRLAFRCWVLDRATMTVRSLNDPGRAASWIATAMASGGGWPHDGLLTAACPVGGRPKPRRKKKKGDDDEEEPPHGPVPSPHCTCGIYATTSMEVINRYLSRDVPVLGVVELGGRVIPGEQGYRAAAARLAAVLLINPALTAPHPILEDLAAAYRVPAVVPHSLRPEDYRDVAGQPSIAAQAEAWLAASAEEG